MLHYSRDMGVWIWQGPCSPPQQGLLGKLWDPLALMRPIGARAQTWGQPMVEEADLPGWQSLKLAVDQDQHSPSHSSLV